MGDQRLREEVKHAAVAWGSQCQLRVATSEREEEQR